VWQAVTLLTAMATARKLRDVLADLLAHEGRGDVKKIVEACGINESYFYRLLRGEVATLGRNKLDDLCAAFPRVAGDLRDAVAIARAEAVRRPREAKNTQALPSQLPALETEDQRGALRTLLQMIDGSPWLLDGLIGAAKALKKAREA
jgi:hypothetical protein